MTNATSLEDQLAGTTFAIPEQLYSVVRTADLTCLGTDALRKSCFAAIYDPGIDEFTLYIENEKLPEIPLESGFAVFGSYRLIRFLLHVPFEGVGFIAAITGAVAKKGVNVLALSAYSCDYLLVKDEDVGKARDAIAGLGMKENVLD
jgi:Uncharacterized conserved protein